MMHWLIDLLNNLWFWIALSSIQSLITCIIVRAANEMRRGYRELQKQLFDVIDRYGKWANQNESLQRELDRLNDFIKRQGA